MIHRFLCRIGIHAWTQWFEYTLTGTAERVCILCDRQEYRWLPRKIVHELFSEVVKEQETK